MESKTVFYFLKFKAQKCQYGFKKKTLSTNDVNYLLKKLKKKKAKLKFAEVRTGLF